MLYDTASQGQQVISALQGADDVSVTALPGEVHKHLRDPGKTLIGDFHLRQRIIAVG